MGCLIQWLLRIIVSILLHGFLFAVGVLVIFRWVRWLPPPVAINFFTGQKIIWQWKTLPNLPPLKNETLATEEFVRYNFFGGRKDRLIDIGVFLIARLIKVIWGSERIQTIYWNSIPWGKEIWGIGGAARIYFGKPFENLKFEEVCQLLYLRKYVEKVGPDSEILPWAKRKAQKACRGYAL